LGFVDRTRLTSPEGTATVDAGFYHKANELVSQRAGAMSNSSRRILECFLACLIAPNVRAGDDTSPYRTKDGQFTHALQMENLRPGDAGLAGLVWTIEPNPSGW
jgi:hypothetical protein